MAKVLQYIVVYLLSTKNDAQEKVSSWETGYLTKMHLLQPDHGYVVINMTRDVTTGLMPEGQERCATVR